MSLTTLSDAGLRLGGDSSQIIELRCSVGIVSRESSKSLQGFFCWLVEKAADFPPE